MADQPDKPLDLADLPPPLMSSVTQDAAVSTSVMPFAEPPITTAPKSKAQKQREYRQRIAASRTPAEVISARIAETARKRKYRLRAADKSALADVSLQSKNASSSSATGGSTLSVQPSTSLDPVEVQQAQYSWITKCKFSTILNNEFSYACSICDKLWFQNNLKPLAAANLEVISDWIGEKNRQPCREEYELVCSTCQRSLNKKSMPPLAKLQAAVGSPKASAIKCENSWNKIVPNDSQTADNIEEIESSPEHNEESYERDEETNPQSDMNTSENTNSLDKEVIVLEGKMDDPQDEVEVPDGTTDSAADDIQSKTENSDVPSSKDEKRNPMPLDKFKRRLVRAVARKLQEKKTEEAMWEELKNEIGCDCKMLWQHMRALTLKKLKRLLPANDLLKNLKKIVRFTATDWLLFDLILVHEKINVISIKEGETAEDENMEEPSCLYDLFELVKEHRVESLSGDDLIEAWIRITIQYNIRGRQCSPMILQLRWYQLKELTRARFYNFWCAYRGNHRVLDHAMKSRPTKLQTAIAAEYKKVVTQVYPEWEKLIEERRIILSEEFAMNRQASRKTEETREENDVDIEVIEPLVETIELEVDSDTENDCGDEIIMKTTNCFNNEDNVEETNPHSDKVKKCSNISLDRITTAKSESDDEILDLDGLSDVETMHIPHENIDGKKHVDNPNENTTEEIVDTLPKITKVVGNVVDETELIEENKTNTLINRDTSNDVDLISDTSVVADQCLEIEGTDGIQCESDTEINEILHEKASTLMNISITQIKSECEPDYEVNKMEINSENITSDCNNKLTLSDSEEEIDELLQKKANSLIGVKSLQSPFEMTEETLNGNSSKQKQTDTKENEYSNIHVDRQIVQIEDDIVKEAIKNEEYDDDFDDVDCDDVDFDEAQIEFVDDGIEFVEEGERDKKKTNDVNIELARDIEEDSTSEIDLKLLMNPIVYTKKLELMDIFKHTDYKYVNSKTVIESAILESKIIAKLALTDEDIVKFREQSLHGYENDNTQTDSDVINTEPVYTSNRVKCTSWMLQKPKNRSYNPIKLCKNPDFNTRLKRLTAGFFSSTRNTLLLKECKPLTVDLNKAFEKKLINGTMYLKSADFKAADCPTTDKINNEVVTVLPSVIPGQAMIFATSAESNVLSEKKCCQENNLSLVSSIEKNITNERRKTINLPDIDQVRRVNQSLLTAEVTPIRIASKVNNIESDKEPVKTSTETAFVQPIVVAPFAQIKNEPSDLNLDDKNKVLLQIDMSSGEPSSRKDIMANKITDQIINLSNQISQVEKNDFLEMSVEKEPQKETEIKIKLGRKPTNNVKKAKAPPSVNKLTYVPRYTGKLTWSPKYPKNHIADSLLTLDTLSKILFLLNGNEDEIKHCSCKQKKLLKKQCTVAQRTTVSQSNKKGNNKIKSCTNKSVHRKNKGSNQPGAPKGKVGRPRLAPVEKYSGIYCCWAREKIICITTEKHLDPGHHGCVVRCKCCCRQELVKCSKWKATPPAKNPNKISSTIVLSDDEDVTKVTQNSEADTISNAEPIDKAVSEIKDSKNNSDTPNEPEKLNKVTIEILMPPLTPIANKITSTNKDVNSIAIQTEVFKKKSNDKGQHASGDETELVKKHKLCKTLVHAAVGPVYNKRIEPISGIGKEQMYSARRESVQTIGNTYKESPKHAERTLFLNSSQIATQPKRTPVYLGKNKILLCSFKNPSFALTTEKYPLPVLPYGVNFVMTPSGELTLTVDNGVQLDAEQFSTLPAIMAVVQDQYLKSNIFKENPEHTAIPHDIGDVATLKQSNLGEIHNTKNDENNSANDISTTKTENENAIKELSNLNVNDGTATVLADNENEVSIPETVGSEIDNTESESLKSRDIQQETEHVTKEQFTETESTVEKQENDSQATEKVPPAAETCLVDNNDASKDKTANMRKTILSDLMEMSGISAEDTNMATEVLDINITPLPPNIIPVTRTTISGIDMLNASTTSNNVPENITIAGPYSNLLSFEGNSPLNHLLRCIAQIRPELNAVTSFAELKYVYSNDGIFYKLDVDTGHISEIKVFIKKNPKTSPSSQPNAFIDLTEDTCNEENVACAEFQDIPQDKQGNAGVKPIKLFKAVHPAILRRAGRSILKENEVAYTKKPIRITKQRRKQLLNVGSNKYVIVGMGNKNAYKKTQDLPTSHMDSSYDSSDEEPLAKKSKRKKLEEPVEAPLPLFEETPALLTTTTAETVDVPANNEYDDTSDIEMNSMDIQGVNPELHPVAFEEGSESDEDMCILGV